MDGALNSENMVSQKDSLLVDACEWVWEDFVLSVNPSISSTLLPLAKAFSHASQLSTCKTQKSIKTKIKIKKQSKMISL